MVATIAGKIFSNLSFGKLGNISKRVGHETTDLFSQSAKRTSAEITGNTGNSFWENVLEKLNLKSKPIVIDFPQDVLSGSNYQKLTKSGLLSDTKYEKLLTELQNSKLNSQEKGEFLEYLYRLRGLGVDVSGMDFDALHNMMITNQLIRMAPQKYNNGLLLTASA